MAEQVLKARSLPTELEELITSKGEGNPFYIEEVTKSLLESGVLRRENGGYALERPAAEVAVPGHDPGGDPQPHRPPRAGGQGGDPARVGDRPRVHGAPARAHLGRAARSSTTCWAGSRRSS